MRIFKVLPFFIDPKGHLSQVLQILTLSLNFMDHKFLLKWEQLYKIIAKIAVGIDRSVWRVTTLSKGYCKLEICKCSGAYFKFLVKSNDKMK